jgi:3-methyladenine DNA glycosylase AlkD
MTATEIVKQLEASASASYKKILMNHGAANPVLGVKIAELKKLQKRINRDYQRALDLYDTGIYDAQYLAGLIADDALMTKRDLRRWLAKSNCPAICASVVAWVAAESEYGRDLALDWIESEQENTAQTGWMVLASLVAVTDDADLDISELSRLLSRIERTIHRQPNLVRYAMNSFVIAAGTYVAELTAPALRAAEKIGPVSVDMGDTGCEVPSASQHIQKAQSRGVIGKKRKTAKC